VVEDHGIEGYQGKAIEIAVKDNGVGIEEGVIPQIFDRYYQSGKSISFDQASSGIGLSLAAKLTQIHHGKISLESKLNVGSTFTVCLPLGRDYLKDDEIKKDVRQLNEDLETLKSETAKYKYINTITKEHILEREPDLDKDVVLIVEDSEDIRFFIKGSLGKKYSFIEAENGVEGLELAQKYMPDLIVTDIMMPQMDGYEFCSAIKSSVETSHIPVIMLTSKSGELSEKIGLEKGADDYISKPFNIDILDARISNLIKSRTDLRKRFNKEIVIKPSDVVITSTDEKFLSKAIKTVENHMSEPHYDIETFSRDMAMSQSTLYRKLKALTGESTNNFIKNLRLNRGASLLSQNEISVSEIANMVGFDDPAYFSKSFKQKFGISPTEYSKKFL
jgi:DNA-binding response OmpR family regulator